ncbi:MAG: ABC transporter substrate-binding protein, partial [Chitinophagaceae bacterium]
MKPLKLITAILLAAATIGCQSKKAGNIPVVGFVDAFEDATIAQARTGFTDALKKNGFNEADGTVKIAYRNAQGDIPTLTQIVNYFTAEKVDLFATCTTLSTITAVQKNKITPIFAMVAPTAALMKVTDAAGKGPANLYGAVEDMNY